MIKPLTRTPAKAFVTIWRPDDTLLESLHEGHRFMVIYYFEEKRSVLTIFPQVRNLQSSPKGRHDTLSSGHTVHYLSATKNTQFTPLTVDAHHVSPYQPRFAMTVSQMPSLTPYMEIDACLIVAHFILKAAVSEPNLQSHLEPQDAMDVFLFDPSDSDAFVVVSLRTARHRHLITSGQILALSNLQYQCMDTRLKLHIFQVTDDTIITTMHSSDRRYAQSRQTLATWLQTQPPTLIQQKRDCLLERLQISHFD